MRTAAFIYDDILSRHVLREDHVLIPTRLRYTYELLQAYGAFQEASSRLLSPRPATEEELLSFHTREYLDAVKSFSRGERRYNPAQFNFSDQGDNPVFPGMYQAASWTVGASLAAAQVLVSGQAEVAVNFAGGLHHAMPGYASGFCVFNDPVIAIKALVEQGLRVAYVDIDCHHGDGVQYAFYDTDAVLTISLHESGEYLFPGTGFPHEIGVGKGAGYSVNLPLAPNTDDALYLWAFHEVVPPLVRAYAPDVLVTQLGIDTHFNDPITHLKLTVQGYGSVVQALGELSPGRWLALGGGGYDVTAVLRAWTLAYGVMLGREWPDDIPASFQERYGIVHLRDPQGPGLSERARAEAHRFAQESVAQAKRLLFPLHGLSRLA